MTRILTVALLLSVLLAIPALTAGNLSQCTTLLKSLNDDGDRFGDTPLGCIAADALRAAADADLALFPAGMLGGNMEAGSITEETLAGCYPREEPVLRVTLDWAELKTVLEYCAAGVVFDERAERVDKAASSDALFPQVSGIELSYDLSGPSGDRVWSVTPAGGERMRDFPPNGAVVLAFPMSLTDVVTTASAGSPEDTGATVRSAVTQYITASGGTLPVSEFSRRVTLLGTGNNPLIGGISPLFWVLFALVVLIFSGARYRKKVRGR
ncbi:MAG: 5'-nucleotidase C-terminal domain-containing protein [Oscillospiraceae bacterium]|nr:5'-nucleotidase C-terminal domain-containing protein [Oscillospiraceae bacterium]